MSDIQTVNLPNGDTAQFPSSMSSTQIESILSDHSKTNPEIMKPKTSSNFQPPSIPGGSLGSAAIAASNSYLGGVANGIESLGSLAHNILSGISSTIYDKQTAGMVNKGLQQIADKGMEGVNSLKDFANPQTPIEQEARRQNPITSGVAETVGAVGTQIAGLNSPLNGATKAISPILESVPGLAKNPIISNAVSQGTLGAGIGAASNPEDPVKGALMGGAAGAAFGGLSGASGESFRTSGKIIADTRADLAQSGKDLYSLPSLRVQQANLKDEGQIFRSYEEKLQTRAAVDEQMAKLRPSSYTPGTSPISLIANKTIENAPIAKAQNTANYAPIDSNTNTFEPKNYKAILSQEQDNLPKIGLPKDAKGNSTLQENPTLGDMLQYRQQLDGSIKQAQAQAANGKIRQDAVLPYYKLRAAINQDIHESADSIPYQNLSDPAIKSLGDQLIKAEDFHNTNVKPFQLIDKRGNIQDNPKAENAVWNNISAQLQARRPNFQKIMENADRLGPDGKELLGWGVQENAFNKATAESGEYKPDTHQSMLTRIKASGLGEKIYTPEQKAVAKATSDIITAGSKVKAKAAEQGKIGQSLNFLTKSRAGIELLRQIGNPSTSAQAARNMIQQLVTGILSSNAASSKENN